MGYSSDQVHQVLPLEALQYLADGDCDSRMEEVHQGPDFPASWTDEGSVRLAVLLGACHSVGVSLQQQDERRCCDFDDEGVLGLEVDAGGKTAALVFAY